MLDDFVFDSRISWIPENLNNLPLRSLVSTRGQSDCYGNDLSVVSPLAGLVGDSDAMNYSCVQRDYIWIARMSTISPDDSCTLSLQYAHDMAFDSLFFVLRPFTTPVRASSYRYLVPH